MIKDIIKQKNMYFEYIITGKCDTGFFSIMKDRSLLYSTQGGNFSILLGGDWRFELNVDRNTDRCINFQGTLIGNIQENEFEIPPHHKGNLYFRHNDEIVIGSGCHYLFIENNLYCNSTREVLCVGNPHSEGIAIEFADKIIAVVHDNNLVAIYLNMKDAYKE